MWLVGFVIFFGSIWIGRSHKVEHVCPPDENCTVVCSAANANCTHLTVFCPTYTMPNNTIDNDIEDNNAMIGNLTCTVLCPDSYSCAYLTIVATQDISLLSYYSNEPEASGVINITSAANNVYVSCRGQNACYGLNITAENAQSVTLIGAHGDSHNGSGIIHTAWTYGGMSLSNCANVLINCTNERSCLGDYIELRQANTFHLICSGWNSCQNLTTYIEHVDDIHLQALEKSPTIQGSQFTWDTINNVTIQSVDNGFADCSFQLSQIKGLMLDIEETGSSPGTYWYANQIADVAIGNSWNTTSIWLVDGGSVSSSYACPSKKDCNIRSDVSRVSAASAITVNCPVDSSDDSTLCRFYCTSLQGCQNISINAKSTTKVVINSNEANGAFKVVANAPSSHSGHSVFNLTCNAPRSCAEMSFIAEEYDWVNVNCSKNSSCAETYFQFHHISQEINISANSQGMASAIVQITNSSSVVIDQMDEKDTGYGGAFNGSVWNFNNIGSIEFYCGKNNQCWNTSINSVAVSELTIVCGSEHSSDYACRHAHITATDSMVDLMCQGDGYLPCKNMKLVCPKMNDKYGCEITCQYNNVLELPNCKDMIIQVSDSDQGYNDLSLECASDACQNISIVCSSGDLSCSCPVLYDTEQEEWRCNGPCGTEQCGAQGGDGDGDGGSGSSSSTGLIIGVVIGVVLLLIAFGSFLLWRYKKHRGPEISGRTEPLKNYDPLEETDT